MTTHDERGFTLVEVMVSLLIFGMIAAAGVAILSFSVRAQDQTNARFDSIGALTRTLSLMSGDLGQAVIRPARDETGTMRPAFTGESDGRMTFVRNGWSNIDGAPRASVQKVSYALADGVFQRSAYSMVDGAQSLPPTPLLTDVTAVSARYRYKGAWTDRWDGAAGAPLPDAVELSVARKGGEGYRAVMLVGTGFAPPPQPGMPTGGSTNAAAR